MKEGTNYKKASILATGLQTNLFIGEQQQLRYAKLWTGLTGSMAAIQFILLLVAIRGIPGAGKNKGAASGSQHGGRRGCG